MRRARPTCPTSAPPGSSTTAGSHPRRSHRGRNIVLTGLAIAIAAALITILVLAVSRPGPAWPASVAKVEREIATACQNPDVRSEPSQVNFACAKATRQILWVFSLMTSGNNPDFASIKTGRQGLEPIRPVSGRSGGVVAEPAPPL